ncbi:MAG: MSCRAMM family protein, partial [Planctomycetota bacterium]
MPGAALVVVLFAFVLRPRMGQIRGSLVDPTLAPVAGAWVTLQLLNDEGSPFRTVPVKNGVRFPRLPDWTQMTDRAGGFRFARISTGSYTLSANAPEGSGLVSVRHRRFEVAAGEALDLDLTLARSAAIKGAVTGPDGGGVAAVSVMPVPLDWKEPMMPLAGVKALFDGTLPASIDTDSTGRFRVLDDLPAGQYRLTFRPPEGSALAPAAREIELVAG